MTLNLECPSCGRSQRVSDEVVGLKVRCPHCRATFRVAGPDDPSRPAAEPARPRPTPAAAGPAPRPDRTKPRPGGTPEFPAAPDFARKGGAPGPRPRNGPAPWVYGVGGGAAAGILVAIVVAIATGGDPAPAAPAGAEVFPDPSVDIALGVASEAGSAPKVPVAARDVPPANPAPAAVPVANNAPPAALAASNAPPPTAPTPPGTPLTTAQIVAKCEPSVALVKGHSSSGTGFLVRPGIVATNAHVIDEEFISALEVRFPSAPDGQQGPLPAELLYEDPKRDLAFLRVATNLPALEVAPSYRFVKGEDITVIGNPGLGEEVVLENAISRGVMSSKAVLDGQNYLQINMAINPGNSGGPVFDSSGRVIGVATLKSTKAEAMAFSIPVEDVQAAMAKLNAPHPEFASQHRAQVAFKLLTVAGGFYGVGLDIRAVLLRKAPPGGKPNLLPNDSVKSLDELLSKLDEKLFTPIEGEVARIRNDAGLNKVMRGRYEELSAGYRSMKELYANTNRPADQYAARVKELRANYLRGVEGLQRDLKIEVPAQLLTLLKMTVNDAQPQVVITQIMPAPLQSRILRNPRLQPRGAMGPRLPGQTPGQAARDRMQDLRNRARSRARGGS